MRKSLAALLLVTAALSLSGGAARAQRPGDCGFYAVGPGAHSEGRHCAATSQDTPPRRVTAICRDKSYSFEYGRWACWAHGGVQTWKR